MAESIGALHVNLSLDGTNFSGGLTKAESAAKNFGKQATSGFAGMEGSAMKARGSLMLMSQELGVKIPRHLQRLIVAIPGVGAAFSAMLPLAGIGMAGVILAKLIQKHEDLAIAMRKAADEAENFSIKEMDTTKSMQLANLKLDDQIAKLEGRPTVNKLKEAFLESSIAVDKLEESLSAQFEKMNTAIEKTTGFFHKFWEDLKAAAFTKGFDLIDVGKATGETRSALEAVQAQMGKIRDLEADLASAGNEEQKKAVLAKLAVAYTLLGNEQAAAANLVFKNMPDEVNLYTGLAHAAGDTAEHVKQIGLEVESDAKKAKIAGLEMATVAKSFTAYGPKMVGEDSNDQHKKMREEMEKLADESDELDKRFPNPFAGIHTAVIDASEEVRAFYDNWNKQQGGTVASINADYDDQIEHWKEIAKVAGVTNQVMLDGIKKLNDERTAGLEEFYKKQAEEQMKHGTASIGTAFSEKFGGGKGNEVPGFQQLLGTQLATSLDRLNQGIANLIVTGKGLDFKKLVQSFETGMIEGVLKKMESNVMGAFGVGKRDGNSALNALWVQMVEASGGEAGAGGFQLSKIPGLGFLSMFGLAGGGDVVGGGAYIVGEEGPEVFTPGTSGSIVPNNALGGDHSTHYHIDARGADAGAEERIRAALRDCETRSVVRSVSAVNELQRRRSS